ncbi:response regulator transcription factor [Arthrobacter sp. B0490]|uniref:response regulator n=1 Tax=Arthrobacter sp. B0490 TaxID=2058891 RepID=UPI000CE2FF6A|nr:response regulator transcription factor [Arthrobacter sp. B0490]
MDETSDPSTISVGIVDDQTLFRSGLGMLIESQNDLYVAGEAGDGNKAIALAKSARPDILLMDVRMPVLNGVQATKEILGQWTEDLGDPPRIIALTTYNQDQAVIHAIQAGASGFLLKSAEPEFLLAAIRTVHRGQAVVAAGDTHRLFQTQQPATPRPNTAVLDVLSAREVEVFILAAKGLSNSDIGHSLFVAEGTVKGHVRNILAKLELRTRIQLVALAYENHLLGVNSYDPTTGSKSAGAR